MSTPISTVQQEASSQANATNSFNSTGLLFNDNIDVDSTNQAALLEQYKLYVESANLTSSLRSQANTFFLTINTALISFLTGLVAISSVKSYFNAWITFGCLAGLLLTISWFFTLRSYRALNSGRFAVIQELETKLPAQIYAREWELITSKRPIRRRYIRQSYIEQTIPIAFGILYIGFALTATILA